VNLDVPCSTSPIEAAVTGKMEFIGDERVRYCLQLRGMGQRMGQRVLVALQLLVPAQSRAIEAGTRASEISSSSVSLSLGSSVAWIEALWGDG